MPCDYIIDKKRRLILCTGWDHLTFGDMKAQQVELANNPEFDPSFNQLVDVSKVTHLDLSIPQAKTIAKHGIYLPTSRRAVVVASPEVYGMARLMDTYHSLATGREMVRVFYHREEALQWLVGVCSIDPIAPSEVKSIDANESGPKIA